MIPVIGPRTLSSAPPPTYHQQIFFTCWPMNVFSATAYPGRHLIRRPITVMPTQPTADAKIKSCHHQFGKTFSSMRLCVGYQKRTMVPHKTNGHALRSMLRWVRSRTSRTYVKSLLATSVFITAPPLSLPTTGLVSFGYDYSLFYRLVCFKNFLQNFRYQLPNGNHRLCTPSDLRSIQELCASDFHGAPKRDKSSPDLRCGSFRNPLIGVHSCPFVARRSPSWICPMGPLWLVPQLIHVSGSNLSTRNLHPAFAPRAISR